MQPEMSAAEVTENLVAAVKSDKYDLIVVNYANPDMVGHTGDIEAAMAACSAVDAGLGQVITAVEVAGGAMIVCADHGNCETMVDPDTGEPHTAHTTNPVPVVLIGAENGVNLRSGGRLADIAPTLLALMGLPQPVEMTGISLIED
jgi:2,3-bisphosphoglycerate-independent phosphoglycerate mutase